MTRFLDFRFFVLMTAALLLAAASCRSPKKVLTEHDKQQIKDNILAEMPAVEGFVPVGADFDGKLSLLGFVANKQRVRPGDAVAVTLYWKSVAKVDGDFKIFVHLDSTRARKTYDHYAISGLYPTSAWNPGEVLKDEMIVQIDQTFPAGPAKLWVGFFDAKAWKDERKNVRLAIKNPGTCRTDRQDRLLVTAFMLGDVEEKNVKVRRTPAAPALDGQFDEAGWQQAFVDGGQFYSVDGKPVPEPEKVQVGMLWDDDNLYLALQVADADLQTPYTTRDSTLWSGGKGGSSDVMEMFFDPDADGKDYLELQISPASVIFDARFKDYREPAWKEASRFDLNFSYKVSVSGTLNDSAPDQGYTVEASIPWKNLPGMDGPPTPDRRFAVNFFRLSNSGTWAAAWSPAGNDFHDLTLAGSVSFVK